MTVTRLRHDQAGLSLIELLVASALATLVATMVVSAFVSLTHTITGAARSTATSETAAISMREVSRVLRGATTLPSGAAVPIAAFAEASAASLTLHTFIDADASSPAPTKVRFAVRADGTLVETRWSSSPSGAAGYTFAATPSSERVLTRGVDTSAAAVFRYLDVSGTEIIPAAASQLSETQARGVAAITITLTVDDNSGASRATVTNTVGFPNLGIDRADPA